MDETNQRVAVPAQEQDAKQLTRARLKLALENGLIEIGDRDWSRDSLYDR